MIPRKIHYCWFGRGKKPKLAKKCIESWKRFCPDYEIIEWNEDNFDINQYEYVKYCYREKKWAFLSDFVRLIVVYEQGGIYFDTDVELIKSPNELLKYEAFYGFENKEIIATGLGFGAEKEHKTVKEMIDIYLSFNQKADGSFELIGCPNINTQVIDNFDLVKGGVRQNIGGAEIFPVDYFNPLNDATGKLCITENTIAINHYGKSWMNKKDIIRSRLSRPLHRIFGTDFFRKH